MTDFTFLPPQQNLHDLLKTLEPGARLLVEAEPGAGKTYTLSHSGLDGKIALVAPTHVAKKNLSTHWGEHDHPTYTCHQFSGIRLEEELKTGKTYNRGVAVFPALCEWDWVIIDEIQLMPRAFLTRILSNKKARIVMMGDRIQGQPVMEGISPVFDEAYRTDHGIDYFFLDCQARQTGQLLELSRLNREARTFPTTESETNTLLQTEAELKEAFIDFCRTRPQDYGVYISYTNADIDQMVATLRGSAMGYWEVGDRIRLKSVPENTSYNGSVIVAQKVSEVKAEVKVGTSITYQEVMDELGNIFKLPIPDMKTILAELRKFCQDQGDERASVNDLKGATHWYKQRQGLYKGFDYGVDARCITSSSSTGQTIDYVFLNTVNMKKHSSKGTLAVAISRTKIHLWSVKVEMPKRAEHLLYSDICKMLNVPGVQAKKWQTLRTKESWAIGHIMYWLEKRGKLHLLTDGLKEEVKALLA